MTLLTNEPRCHGERDNGTHCKRRHECARYTERGTAGERTLFFNHMCSSDATARYLLKIDTLEK